jgi:hypothetical protein
MVAAVNHRVLVFGSRSWTDARAVYKELSAIAARVGLDQMVVVHGDYPTGADLYADLWARAHGLEPEPHRADWAKYGKPAGNIRNTVMVAAGADEALGFIDVCRAPRCRKPRPHDSHGSSDCYAKVKGLGIPTQILREVTGG